MENNKKNIAYSPLSIKYALNMLNEGADGETKIQIENVIKNLSLTKYENIDKVLSFANGMFINEKYKDKIKEAYTNTIQEKFNAELKYDSFETPDNVNSWIENKTLGIIKNLLTSEDINPGTAMALINALAIDMEWNNKFKYENTTGRDFFLDDGSKIEATTMKKVTQMDDCSYFIDNDITSLTMLLQKYEGWSLLQLCQMKRNYQIISIQ